jgi:hypothetical protein
VAAHPEVLVQLRDELVADAEGFNVHRRQHEIIRFGEDEKVRRSPQAVACRKRCVEELGRPHRLLLVGSAGVGYTANEARRGNLETGLCWNLSVGMESQSGRRGSTVEGKAPVCVWGVVSSIVLGGGESPLHGEGLDGST